MKIKVQEKRPPTRFAFRLANLIPLRNRAVLQIILILIVFTSGALTYRTGVHRSVTQTVRNILTSNVQAPPPLTDVKKNVQDEIRLYQNNGLPTLYIDLKFQHYQQLREKRAEALKVGILQTSDDDFVPAQVQLQGGPKLSSELRLKGDWTDHLQGDKWSFRIHLKEEGQILGFRQFSIQTPETRNFLNEWVFHHHLIDEGILTTRYEFVNVLLNGTLLGIYAIEESFTADLIESQGRRQGVIIRFNEDLYWDSTANFFGAGIVEDNVGTLTVTDIRSADITAFQASRIARDVNLQAQNDTARAMLYAFQTGQRKASEVFDVGLTGRFFAMSDLWAACHGIVWHNWRFYYNPITGLLEPVAYDNVPFFNCRPSTSNAEEFIENDIFNDAEIRAAYAQELARLTQIDYIDGLQAEYQEQGKHLAAALKVEFSDDDVDVSWEKVHRRRASLAKELQPVWPVKGSFQAVGVNLGDDVAPVLQVDLVNLMLVPVDLIRFEVNGRMLAMPDKASSTLEPIIHPKVDDLASVRFTLSLDDISTWNPDALPQVDVVVRLTGLVADIRVPLSGTRLPQDMKIGPLPETLALDDVLSRHPFLSASPDHTMLLVPPGIWDVRGDLVLPEGFMLHVSPGTVLRFEPGSVLLVRGALNLAGTLDSPVLLTAQSDAWGGVVVLRAEDESFWQYASVEKTAGINRGGWMLTGGITFYQSDIHISHALLGNNMTEDAINIVHGRYSFYETEFEHTFSDAVDSDFSNGEYIRCYFHDIAGDAVDVSGSTVTIRDTRMERVADKGLSAGENSTVTLRNIVMDAVGIGVASKDLSRVDVYETKISNARFAALAAYVKKIVFGPAYIYAPDLIVVDNVQDAIAQTGSTIVLWEELVPPQGLDVEKLYTEGILGN